MKNKWIKRFDSKHPLINIYVLLNTFSKNSLGSQNKNIIVVSRGIDVSLYRLTSENEKLKKIWLKEMINYQKMLRNLKFSQDAVNETEKFVAKINSLKITSLTNQEVVAFYEEYLDNFHKIFVSYNMSQPEVSESAEEYLKEEINKQIKDEKTALDYFLKLTLPSKMNLLTYEELAWLRIVHQAALQKKVNEAMIKKIKSHSEKFGWMSTQENLPYMDLNYYQKKLQDELKVVKSSEIEKIVTDLLSKPNKIEGEHKYILGKLKNESVIAQTSEVIRKLGVLRIDLRLAWTKGAYFTKPLFDEIAKKLGIESGDVCFLLPGEIKSYLLGKEKIELEEIISRKKLYVAELKEGNWLLTIGEKAQGLISSENLEEKVTTQKTVLMGTPANPGLVRGRVKIIHSHQVSQTEEVKKMKKGQILVAGSTKPQLMEAVRKAIAIVTDEGGILSHAAIVSRELGIPCVVGTKIATKVLRDGDLIEVDARKGVIIIL